MFGQHSLFISMKKAYKNNGKVPYHVLVHSWLLYPSVVLIQPHRTWLIMLTSFIRNIVIFSEMNMLKKLVLNIEMFMFRFIYLQKWRI